MSTIKVSTIDTPTSSNFAVKTNSATRLTILQSGNIGVGTALPLAPLHVSGLGAEIRITAPGITGADFAIFPQTLPGSLGTPLFRIFDRYNSLDRLTISSDGLVGIGTSSPTAKLHIVGGQAEALLLTAGTTGDVGLRVYEDADTAGYLRLRPISNTQKGFVFSNYGDTGILNVNTLSNRVGIGTIAPTVALDVAGSIKASTSLILGDVNATMAAPNGSAPIFGARAWGLANWSGTAISLGNAGNIASASFLGSGAVNFTFTTAMPSAEYVVVCHSERLSGGSSRTYIVSKTASNFTVVAQASDGAAIFDTAADRVRTINVAVFC